MQARPRRSTHSSQTTLVLPCPPPGIKCRRGVSEFPERLPFHILTNIFFMARDGNDTSEFDHGGELVHWDSMESARAWTTVCRAWHDAAVFALYHSVAIIGSVDAYHFLLALQAHPERAAYVKFLVVGLHCDDEANPGTARACFESDQVLHVLEALPNIAHLHIRPLHPSARRRLLAALRKKPLRSLVCLPRLESSFNALFRSADLIDMISPELERLDMDFWADSTKVTPATITFPPLALVEVRLFCSNADSPILALLAAAGPRLESIYVYFECLFDKKSAASAALLPSADTLRSLTWVVNPVLHELEARFNPRALQVFDQILPRFTRLVHLRTSATEVSTNLFRILPPALRRIELNAFHHSPSFHFDANILSAINDQTIDFRSLAEFELHDEGWTRRDVKAVGRALRARGVAFIFKPI